VALETKHGRGGSGYEPGWDRDDEPGRKSRPRLRELRNKGGEVVARVVAGEVLTVTRDGMPVARLVPVPPKALSAGVLLGRWRKLPPMDPNTLRRDIDEIIDPSL
jgi:prevent-host-death family protein